MFNDQWFRSCCQWRVLISVFKSLKYTYSYKTGRFMEEQFMKLNSDNASAKTAQVHVHWNDTAVAVFSRLVIGEFSFPKNEKVHKQTKHSQHLETSNKNHWADSRLSIKYIPEIFLRLKKKWKLLHNCITSVFDCFEEGNINIDG